VTYRELRQLELEALMALYGGKVDSARLLLDSLLKVDVDQMHGIEIEEWPARIAEVAMWLIDHQMNQRVGEALRPARAAPTPQEECEDLRGQALQTDWNSVLPAKRCSYVFGESALHWPSVAHAGPADGARRCCGRACISRAGRLDYVTCWHLRAARYMKGECRGGFVSTNSITQGEQARILAAALWGRTLFIHWAPPDIRMGE